MKAALIVAYASTVNGLQEILLKNVGNADDQFQAEAILIKTNPSFVVAAGDMVSVELLSPADVAALAANPPAGNAATDAPAEPADENINLTVKGTIIITGDANSLAITVSPDPEDEPAEGAETTPKQ